MTKKQLKNYAKLIVRAGGNVQKGQDVVLRVQPDQPVFAEYVVEECYKAGAKKVYVDWEYQPMTKLAVKYQSKKELSYVNPYEEAKLKYRLDTLPVLILLHSEDPDGLRGMNMEKYTKAIQEKQKIIKPYRDQMDNKYQWCIAAVPGEKWAKKVFPGLRTSKAVEKLWEAILYCSRCDDDPISAWEKHNKNLWDKCNYLNSLHIKELIYKSSNGTDFKVGMNKEGVFLGGAHSTLDGIYYNANIPSEEVFVSPKKGVADGLVVASKPLSYNGQLIENFSLRFEKGKVVEVKAEKNKELLEKIVKMDENACMLGEIALVPYESPIRQSGILFYETLFDENAACHLALGKGFTNTVKDFEKYTKEQIHEMGVNDSIIHVDFMIGNADMDIKAVCENGKTVQIFKNGTWAF